MNINLKIFCSTLLFLFGYFSVVHADVERDIAIDRAIAGMEEGSRMLAPESYGKDTLPGVQGQALSPASDTKVIISPVPQGDAIRSETEAQGGNFPGGVVGSPDEAGVGGTESVGNGAGSESVNEPPQEPAGETSEPIIDIDAGVDVDSGTIEADVGVNPTGDQILDADVTGSEVDADLTESGLESETQVDIGGAVDIPVEDDIGDPDEPMDETSPIIDIDASADLDSGTVDADLDVNPEGDQLLDADVAGTGADTTTAIETDIGSTSDLTEPVAPVVAEPVIVAPPVGLTAEVDTTSETVGGETDIGIEADVSGTGAGEDVVDDPTDDGLGGL